MELKNKTVFITGSSGFVGSHLSQRLIQEGSRIITLTHHAGKKNRDNSSSEIQYAGDVADQDFITHVLKKHRIDILYHLAAKSLVESGTDDPTAAFDTNIRGTWSVLESARSVPVSKMIIASTVHVYGDNPNVPFRETSYPQPSRPYETSKAAADLLAQTYADTYQMPIEIPRFVNIYGPGDRNTNRIVPKIMCLLLSQKDPELWDIGAVRDYLYIDDAINAYIALSTQDLPQKKRNRVINFGSGYPVSVTTLVSRILKVIDSKRHISFEEPPEDRMHEIKRQYVSIEKAHDMLGWYPQVKLSDGLLRTYAWYEKHMRNVC